MMCVQIWAAGAEAEADSGDLILQGHRSWGPVTDVTVILLNPNHEVSGAVCTGVFWEMELLSITVKSVYFLNVLITFHVFLDKMP